MKNAVTVIIPTTCERNRADQLLKAIDSVLDQKKVYSEILVIVNGKKYDYLLLKNLQERNDLTVKYMKIGSLPEARWYGRSLVKTQFFCFLDDDDILLNDSLYSRISVLKSDDTIDVAVTNGYRFSKNNYDIAIRNSRLEKNDLILSLVECNWFASCSCMFRSETIEINYFQDLMKYYEWTFLAFRCVIEKKVVFINEPFYLINDSNESLSKSKEYLLSEDKVIRKVLTMKIPQHVRKELQKKLSRSLHHIAGYHLANKNYLQAFVYHFKSLLCTGGSAYLLYTRKLILPWFFK